LSFFCCCCCFVRLADCHIVRLVQMFRRKKEKDGQINWNGEGYQPFTCKDGVLTIPPAQKPPRPTGVPHYDEWIKVRPIEMDSLLAAAKCQFMDSKQGALSGTIFVSVNMLMFIIEDRSNPDHLIYDAYKWSDVSTWGFGVKELTSTHPFYRVNPVNRIEDGANAIRILTASHKKKGVCLLHNITSINPQYFPVLVGMLDAVFRFDHHDLPKPPGFDLSSPPQVNVSESSALAQASIPKEPEQAQTSLSPSTNPGPAMNPMMGPGMTSPGMMNPMMNTLMMQQMQQMMQTNPAMAQQMMMANPLMAQQMMMMQRQQQMMMMMQHDPEHFSQNMATQSPGSCAGSSPVENVQTGPDQKQGEWKPLLLACGIEESSVDELVALFEREKIKASQFYDLSHELLKELNVKMGERMMIMKYIEEHKNENP